MSEPITCFWVEPTGAAEITLRRYRSGNGCAPFGYCNEDVPVGRQPLRLSELGHITVVRPLEYADSPLWPAECSKCHRPFGPLTDMDGVSRPNEDGYASTQVNQEPIYRSADGREWTQRSLPPGAMFDAEWMHDWHVGPDGLSLTVVCPYSGSDARSGFWQVDSPATNSDTPWQRTGDPRAPGSITATPSIQTGEYHGWLRNGQLVEA